MQFSNSNMVSVEQILSDVLRLVDDEPMRKFSKGYYTSLIQQSLEKLSFHTYMTKQIEYFDYATQIDIPANCWNVREVYLYNGDCCDISTAQNVWWKRNYRGNAANRVTKNTVDNFIAPYSYEDNVFYYNADGGKIYFSSACAGYEKVMVVFNGIQSPIGTTPIIPIQLRQTVIDMVVIEAFARLKSRLNNPKEAQMYRALYSDAYQRLYDKATGSWWTAINFANSMDTHSRQALLEYLSKAND